MGTSNKNIIKDEQLIEAAKKDRKQFRTLYEKYYEQIFLFVLRRMANEDRAADVTQQAFIKAMVNLPKYKNLGFPFSSWLYRIALNEINLFYRDQSKRRVVELTESELGLVQEEVQEDKHDINMQAMVNAFHILSEGELTLLEMKYFEKRAFKEIGEILGINEGNAKVKLHRIIKKLKKHILGGGSNHE